MKFSYEKTEEKIAYIEIGGEISIDYRDELYTHFTELLNRRFENPFNRIVIDVSEVEYIDSIGISFLVKLYKDTKSMGISFALANVPETIKKIFSMLSLDTLFEFI